MPCSVLGSHLKYQNIDARDETKSILPRTGSSARPALFLRPRFHLPTPENLINRECRGSYRSPKIAPSTVSSCQSLPLLRRPHFPSYQFHPFVLLFSRSYIAQQVGAHQSYNSTLHHTSQKDSALTQRSRFYSSTVPLLSSPITFFCKDPLQ